MPLHPNNDPLHVLNFPRRRGVRPAFVEHFLGIVRAGPCAAGTGMDYSDARYWIDRAIADPALGPGDAAAATVDVIPGIRRCLTATNLAELPANTHLVAAGTLVHVFALYGRGAAVDGRSSPGSVVHVFAQAAGGLAVWWGAVQSDWTPGTNAVMLTPCLGPTDATPTGAADVSVVIQLPVAQPAVSFGAAVGDVLAYANLGGIAVLVNPPLLPRPTARFQGIFNASSDTSSPQYVADFVRAHD